MSISREKRIERAQLRVLFNVPFFAPGVTRLGIVFDDSIDTACTDGQVIKISPKFMDGLTDAQLVTLLCHEVCHPLLGHLWRAPQGSDWATWNQAADHAVNLMLKEFSAQVMSKRLADPFPFPEPHDSYCANPAFSGMCEEHIYSMLNAAKQGGKGAAMPQDKPGGGNGANTPSGGKATGKGQKPSKAPSPDAQGKPQPGSMPSFGQMSQPKAKDASSNKKLRNDWDGVLVQSVQAAKGRGDVPAMLARYVDGLLSPKVEWWEILRNWLREQAADDWTWSVPNRFYDESGFILPSLQSEKMGAVVFATDTSGSVDQELLKRFHSEKQNCLDELRPSSLLDICCDAAITQVNEYRPGDSIDRKAPGGGGTRFEPVFEHCDRLIVPPKCVVYLTDLQGSFPKGEPGYPVVWLVWGGKYKAPFGEVIPVAS